MVPTRLFHRFRDIMPIHSLLRAYLKFPHVTRPHAPNIRLDPGQLIRSFQRQMGCIEKYFHMKIGKRGRQYTVGIFRRTYILMFSHNHYLFRTSNQYQIPNRTRNDKKLTTQPTTTLNYNSGQNILHVTMKL